MFLLLGTFSRWADLTPADSACSGWRVLGLAAYVTWKPGCVFRNPSDVCVCEVTCDHPLLLMLLQTCSVRPRFNFCLPGRMQHTLESRSTAALVQCGLLQLHSRALTAILDLL